MQAFSRSNVQAMNEGIQRAPGVVRQVRTLGQILAQLAIGVLVGAALPRAVQTHGLQAAGPTTRVRPSLFSDYRSMFCAGGLAHAEASS
jgi:hypothetical protein